MFDALVPFFENGAKMMYKRILGSFRPRPRYPCPADAVNVFVPQLLFLYWDTYCCTVVYMNFTVPRNIVAQPMNMFVLEPMFLY